MLTNYHTHTTFSDGRNTPEEIILHAMDRGFDAIGFSCHGYTDFDLRYCMKDTQGYIAEIRRLQEKYRGKMQIYLGIEEDAFYPANRADFDYIIGSSHYFCIDGKYYPIDSNYDYFEKCLAAFDGDTIRLTKAYYEAFCDYIRKRKPDVVGHFDVITKFDEIDTMRFLDDPAYIRLAERYMDRALETDTIFEVNTGAIARGFRKAPYPQENLMHRIKKHGGKVMLASDSHSIDTLDANFDECRAYLKEIGFDCVYALYDGAWKKDYL